MKLFVVVFSTVFLATMPTLLLGKGDTVKITIESAVLAARIEITDPAVRQFNLWSGAGASTFDGSQGFIIDWANRLDAAPAGLHHYKVSFYEGCQLRESTSCRTSEPSLAYVVYYAYHPSTEDGFVYLPGRGGEFAQLNTSHIYRGQEYEGHWFKAAKAWDDFVRPIIIARQSIRRRIDEHENVVVPVLAWVMMFFGQSQETCSWCPLLVGGQNLKNPRPLANLRRWPIDSHLFKEFRGGSGGTLGAVVCFSSEPL
jgi:hypothetical protein